MYGHDGVSSKQAFAHAVPKPQPNFAQNKL